MTAIGVIARSEPRGLGIQTSEVCRHLNPDRVLLVEPQPARWPTNPDWYDQWPTVRAAWPYKPISRMHEAGLDERVVRTWLDGLDVVYTAETLYDWRLSKWAAAAGCGVVCQLNPELLPPVAWDTPDVSWWAATPWLLDRLPAGTRVVPLPVATDRIPQTLPRGDGQPCRFVHVAGHQAMLDRNGTRLLAMAARRLRCPAQFVISGQDGTLPLFHIRDRRVTVAKYPAGFANYWDVYQGDVLVMPRRFGGLCMPAQEAMAAGMCVLMSDCSPNEMWPGPRVRCVSVRDHQMLGGAIPVSEPSQHSLREEIERLSRDRDAVAAYQAEARGWAAAHSWEALLPAWQAALAEAVPCRT